MDSFVWRLRMILEGAIAASMYLTETQIKKIPPQKTIDTVITKQLPQDKLDKFKEWEKEDWYKDDANKDMWDPNWIKKT